MLVSDFMLEEARQRAIQQLPQYDRSLDLDPPAKWRVRIRIEGDFVPPPDSHVGATLFLLEDESVGKEASNSLSRGMELPWLGDLRDMDNWREVEHRHIYSNTVRKFTTFLHTVVHGSVSQASVELYLVENDSYEDQTERDIGVAACVLADVFNSPTEQFEVDISSMDRTTVVGRATFSIEWVRDIAALLAFEVRVRVNKREGWPFTSSRIFFVLYRKESDGQWTPLYLSEVRVKKTDHPDARDSMLFTIAEVGALTATAGNDSSTIRMEFFQYKTSRTHHRLLGFVTTSVLELRQTVPASDLGIKLSTFTNAELVGKVTFNRGRFTANRLFFSLQADFGGRVDANFLFLDFSITYRKGFFRAQPGMGGGRAVLSSNRPYYQLNRLNDDGSDWEVVYRSHVSYKYPGRRMLKYQLAKVNTANLGTDRDILLSLHSGQSAQICRLNFSLAHLRDMKPGVVHDLTFRALPNAGYVTLERKEWTESHAYVSLSCVLGENYSMSDSDDDRGEIVEIRRSDGSSSSSDSTTQRIETPSSSNPASARPPIGG